MVDSTRKVGPDDGPDLADEGPDLAFGRRVRQLRLERSMIAADLAVAAGISSSFLSQIEKGRASPSFRVLQSIADALGVSSGALLDYGPADLDQTPVPAPPSRTLVPTVVRADQRKRLKPVNGPEYQLLSPDLTGRIEFVWFELASGQELPVEIGHEGEEQLVILSGEVALVINGMEYELGPGDAIRYDSSAPHRALNRGAVPAQIISAATPPTF